MCVPSRSSAACIGCLVVWCFKLLHTSGSAIFRFKYQGASQAGVSKRLHILRSDTIEDAIADNETIGGLTMDLIKAFNTFGRFPTACIMVCLGIPQIVVDSWIRSLSLMIRYPTLNNHVGKGIYSTTGVPEGCSISVLAMVATSCFFYFRLVHVQIQPFAYADNWSWLSRSQRQHFIAFERDAASCTHFATAT